MSNSLNHPLPLRPTALTHAQANTSRATGLSLPRSPFPGHQPPSPLPPLNSPQSLNSPSIPRGDRPIDPTSLPWRQTIDPSTLDLNFHLVPLREGWQISWRRWESSSSLEEDSTTSHSLPSTSKSTPIVSSKRSRETAFDDSTSHEASSTIVIPSTSTLTTQGSSTNFKSQLQAKSIHSDPIEMAKRSVHETATTLGGSMLLFSHVKFVSPVAVDPKGKGKEKESVHDIGKRELWVFAMTKDGQEDEMEVDGVSSQAQAGQRLNELNFSELKGSFFMIQVPASLTDFDTARYRLW